MSNINLVVKQTGQVAQMQLQDVITAKATPKALISDDSKNDLTSGSDGKMFVSGDTLTTDTDFASNINTLWSI